MTDADYDYILDEIERRGKIEFEITSLSSAFVSASYVVFLAVFFSSYVFPVTLASFSSKLDVLLKNSSINRDLNFE